DRGISNYARWLLKSADRRPIGVLCGGPRAVRPAEPRVGRPGRRARSAAGYCLCGVVDVPRSAAQRAPTAAAVVSDRRPQSISMLDAGDMNRPRAARRAALAELWRLLKVTPLPRWATPLLIILGLAS